MPLLDHFHPPLVPVQTWESFHTVWAGDIVGWLNDRLPHRFLAQAHIHLGRQVEADIAELELTGGTASGDGADGGGIAVLPEVYAPPAVSARLPAEFPTEGLVEVRDTERDFRIVGVIELVSPGNKDRLETRRAFASKVASYLQKGIGVVVVDVVTNRLANLHDDWADFMAYPSSARMAGAPPQYVASYRPTHEGNDNGIDVWTFPLRLALPLPTVPFSLMGYRVIGLALEDSYLSACRRNRLA